MTSLAATPATPTLHAPARPSVLRTLADLGARTGEAIRAARAYESAGTATARQRILDEFASGVHRAA
jgi:hypothetical protein